MEQFLFRYNIYLCNKKKGKEITVKTMSRYHDKPYYRTVLNNTIRQQKNNINQKLSIKYVVN